MPAPWRWACRTLDAMADGGIHDQLGGGFHRYATDAIWLVPHFEQMLYDNAQLARTYIHAWQLTGDAALPGDGDRHARLPRPGVADRRTAASPPARTPTRRARRAAPSSGRPRRSGPPWTQPTASLFMAAYDVTEDGNWEGRSILRRVRSDADLAALTGEPADDVARRLTDARAQLLAARSTRPQPARDDKVLAGWNGLAHRRPGRCGPGPRVGGRRDRRPLSRPRRGRRRPSSSTGSGSPMDGCAGAGRTAGRRPTASSRITPASRRGSSPCTRPPSTNVGSWPPVAWPTPSWTGSPIRPAASSTRATPTRRSSPGRRTSRTTPSRRATRWRSPSCSASPR